MVSTAWAVWAPVFSAQRSCKRQKPYVLTRPVGHSIVRFADRETAPFLMQTPMAAFGKDVSDAEVSTHMRAHWKSSAHSSNRMDSASETTDVSSDYPQGNDAHGLLPQSADGELTPTMIKLLESIRDDPYLTSAARYRSIDLSVRKCTQAIEQLVVQGFINELTISTGTKGRSGKYFEFTAKAEQMLGRQSPGKGKGGFTHRSWQHRIKLHYENLGYRAAIEAYIDGKSVDVGVWKLNQRIAIEVEMSAAHASENIVKDLAAGWDEVLVAYADKGTGRRARHELAMRRDSLEEGWYEKVSFIPLKELLK